jgi:hypothetical protein
MDEKQMWDIVEKKLVERVGSVLKMVSYMEYATDLIAQVVKDLSGAIDTTTLPQEAQDHLAQLNQLLTVSSIDFANIASPYESFKIPRAMQVKQTIAEVRKPYLDFVISNAQK